MWEVISSPGSRMCSSQVSSISEVMEIIQGPALMTAALTYAAAWVAYVGFCARRRSWKPMPAMGSMLKVGRVEPVIGVLDGVFVIPALHALHAGFGHRIRHGGLGKDVHHMPGKLVAVANFGDEAGFAAGGGFIGPAAEKLGAGANVGGDHGHAGGEAFDDHKRQAFADAGEHHHIDDGQE